MSNDVQDVYVALLVRLRANRIIFRLSARLQPSEADVDGYFCVRDGGKPVIQLFRDRVPFDVGRLSDSDIARIVETALDVDHEVVTLAHEYGHFESHRCGLRDARYLSVSDEFFRGRPLNPSTSSLIWEEECRAWAYAVALLKEFRYSNQKFLRNKIQEAEAEYRMRLPNLDNSAMPFGPAGDSLD